MKISISYDLSVLGAKKSSITLSKEEKNPKVSQEPRKNLFTELKRRHVRLMIEDSNPAGHTVF